MTWSAGAEFRWDTIRVRWIIAGLASTLASVAIQGQESVPETTPADWRKHVENGDFAAAQAAIVAGPPLERDRALASLARSASERREIPSATIAALQIRDDQLRFQTLWQPGFGFPQFGGGERGGPAGQGWNGFGNRGIAPAVNVPGANGPGVNANTAVNGAGGGGAQADFATLMELITSTVAPETWEEVGGTGTLAPFPGGVLIDAEGMLSPVSQTAEGGNFPLATSDLVRVSLPRLESALLARHAMGLPVSGDLRRLGELDRIAYVVVDRDVHDVLLVGPRRSEASLDHATRLSDLVVILHNVLHGDGRMVCSITPRAENLAATQEFLAASAARPLRPGERGTWLQRLQSQLGRQDIQYVGLPPDTHAAQVLVAADYHMKRVGLGIEASPDGLVNYLDRVEVDANGNVPPMEVLRWWFTLATEPVTTNPSRTVFALPAQSMRVLSENELLTERGARVQTGQAEPMNRAFAESFTQHLPELEQRYPVYRELHEIFDLAIVAALLRNEGILDEIGWEPTLLASMDPYVVPRTKAAREVETVIQHRVLDRRTFIAGISGGVDLAPVRDVGRANERRYDPALQRAHQTAGALQDRHDSAVEAVRWK